MGALTPGNESAPGLARTGGAMCVVSTTNLTSKEESQDGNSYHAGRAEVQPRG